MSFALFTCKDAGQKELDFCKMLSLDQSNVFPDTINGIVVKPNSETRVKLFEQNFKQLIQYSEQNGFPELGPLKATGLDSCRRWAVVITLFHIGQSQPKLFFEKHNREVLQNEIENGRMSGGDLFAPLREGFNGHTFCIRDKDEMYAALKAWKLDSKKLPKITFVECEK